MPRNLFKGGNNIEILFGVIGVVVVLLVIAYSFPVLWPMVTTAGANITAMTGTDNGTVMVKTFWPVVLLLVGLAIGIALIVFALKKFDLLGGHTIS